MEEYLSTRQIAQQLHINIITVRRWIKKGILPAIRLERALRIKKSDFSKFLDQRKVKI